MNEVIVKEQSDVVANTIDMPVDWNKPTNYVAIKYFDADPTVVGANEVTPTGGTVTCTAKLEVHDKYVGITDGTFAATDPTLFASFVGNASKVRAVPAGITGATHYMLCVVQNEVM